METSETKITFCKLCLNVITDGNFKVMDEKITKVLDVLLLKLDVEENLEHVICNACSGKLLAAFDFKVSCMHTEDLIFPYVDSENVTPIDLRDIYLKIGSKESLRNVSEDERICRLCMQFITCGFTKVKEIDNDMIDRYIPEITFNYTRDPIVCSLCLDSLNTHGSFLMTYLDLEEKIKNINDDSPPYIKKEEIEIKNEDYNEYDNITLHDDELIDEKIKGTNSPNLSEFKNNNPSNLQMYKCDVCDFKTKYRDSLRKHQRRHIEPPKEKIYKLDIDFNSKNNFKPHQSKPKDLSKLRKYKCETCDFKTTRKENLMRHQLIHKDFSEVQVYECDSCDYRTKTKGHLTQHQLKHKDISEVQMYKCDLCDYRGKMKAHLIQHQLKHKDFSEVPIYNCDTCDFKSKYKDSLTKHQRKQHDKCDFKVEIKDVLTPPQSKHKDFSEAIKYKCEVCDFKTTRKSNLISHQLKHKDSSEVQTYQCDACDYKSKYRSNLKKHLLRHESSV